MGNLFLALLLAVLTITPGSGQMPPDLSGLSQLERTTLDTVVVEFNAKRHHRHAYKPLAVLNNEEQVVPEGKFVTLEFTLKPTTCKNQDFQPEKCPYRRAGRTQTCVACYKYDSNAEPMAEFWDCIPIRTPTGERKQRQQQKCEEVKATATVLVIEHMPGMFTLARAHQPSLVLQEPVT